MKKIKIKYNIDFLEDRFKVKSGDIYDVISEFQGESKYGYLINTKNKLAIVVYSNEVEVIEEKYKNDKI